MEGRDFWNRIDAILKSKHMTLIDLCRVTGIPRSTIYRQRERAQLPKMREFKAIESMLDIWLDDARFEDKENRLSPYISALFSAEDWQLEAVDRLFKLGDHDGEILKKYYEQPIEVRAAIDRMLGLEKKSGESGIKVG